MADYNLQYQDTYIDALLATANELKTAGYIYKGVATPSTNPGTPTERVAYLASEPGTYTNFGGIVITSGLYSLTYVSGTWTGTQMQAGTNVLDIISVIDVNYCVRNAALAADGTIITTGVDARFWISNEYNIPAGTKYLVYSGIFRANTNFSYGYIYDSSDTPLLILQNSGEVDLTDYPTASKVIIGYRTDQENDPKIAFVKDKISINDAVYCEGGFIEKSAVDCTEVGAIKVNGDIQTDVVTGWYTSSPIDIGGCQSIEYASWGSSNFLGGCIYDGQMNMLTSVVGNGKLMLSNYPSAKYLILGIAPNRPRVYVKIYRYDSGMVDDVVMDINDNIDNIKSELTYEDASGFQAAGNIDTTVNADSASNYYAMGVADSAAEHDGNITNVSFCPQNTGTITFMVGVWDETHEYFNLRATYNYSVLNAYNQTMPVNIPILQGETLMVNMSSGVKIKLRDYSSSTPPAGSKNAIISVDGGNIYRKYGLLRTYLSWTIAWADHKTLKQQVQDNESAINSLVDADNTIGQRIGELETSRLLIQGNDGKIYKLVVNNGILGVENTTPQNVLILAHSFACILTGAWQRGMSSSKIATDWVSQINSVFLADDVTRFNMVSWEQAFPNPSSQLSSLNSYLTASVDAIFIMCGANVASAYKTQQYGQTNYAELVNYCKARATNADIYVCSPGYTPETDGFNIGIKAGAESAGATYISTYSTQADKLANFGDVVWDASNSAYTFVINSNGRVNHPNDIWHLYMANNILSALGYNTLDKYHDISYNTSVEHRGYTRWVAGGHCTFCTFGNSQPVVSIVDANNNAVSFNIMDLSGVTWADTPPTIPKFAVHFDMPDSNIVISIQ
jgi:hypothetical protein